MWVRKKTVCYSAVEQVMTLISMWFCVPASDLSQVTYNNVRRYRAAGILLGRTSQSRYQLGLRANIPITWQTTCSQRPILIFTMVSKSHFFAVPAAKLRPFSPTVLYYWTSYCCTDAQQYLHSSRTSCFTATLASVHTSLSQYLVITVPLSTMPYNNFTFELELRVNIDGGKSLWYWYEWHRLARIVYAPVDYFQESLHMDDCRSPTEKQKYREYARNQHALNVWVAKYNSASRRNKQLWRDSGWPFTARLWGVCLF